MGDYFSGLERFGLKDLSDMTIFEESSAKGGSSTKAGAKPLAEPDFLFDKTYTCPVCDQEFRSKTIRTGKVKLVTSDSDLRPKYQGVDSLKYDAVVCPHCGYAALNRFFQYMTAKQAKMVKEKISANFKPNKVELSMYSYEEAILRHKLALVNTVVTMGKASERAYICLKIAWLYRGEREQLKRDMPNVLQIARALKKQEDEFLFKAYEGFSAALMKETFPMCGMDEFTVEYLLAELARRAKRYEEALRLVSKIIVSRDANERIKNKAREVKAKIQQEASGK